MLLVSNPLRIGGQWRESQDSQLRRPTFLFWLVAMIGGSSGAESFHVILNSEDCNELHTPD